MGKNTKNISVLMTVLLFSGAVGLLSRLIAGSFDFFAIIGIVTSSIMLICGIIWFVFHLYKNKK